MEGGQLDAAPIWSDLKSFPWKEFSGLVDILSGGYPCQPFSAAGKRAGADDPRHLWPFIASGIQVVRPKLCFFENVEGHISLGLREVIADLESLGYKTTWGIFSAAEVGAPHQRRRVFILANSLRERGQLSIEREQPAEQMSGSESKAWRAWRTWSTKPGVCRGNDGSSNRVDRLRLLGNGVVPATAELAFRTLFNELH
jgi:site-specific DNA-cytosine methylase